MFIVIGYILQPSLVIMLKNRVAFIHVSDSDNIN